MAATPVRRRAGRFQDARTASSLLTDGVGVAPGAERLGARAEPVHARDPEPGPFSAPGDRRSKQEPRHRENRRSRPVSAPRAGGPSQNCQPRYRIWDTGTRLWKRDAEPETLTRMDRAA